MQNSKNQRIKFARTFKSMLKSKFFYYFGIQSNLNVVKEKIQKLSKHFIDFIAQTR